MEAHPSLPEGEYFGEMIEIVGEIVEEHIPESPAEEDSEEYEKKEAIEVVGV